MCVIVVKPAGAECPGLDTLKACWESNSDGAGLAMSERGSVFWRKGFMKFDDLAAYYDQEKLPLRVNQAIVFHFRIGTHGAKDGGNTHPFPLSGNPDVLRQLAGRAPVTVAHNGVFRNTVTLPKVSDTGQFIADCCAEHGGAAGDPDIVGYWKRNKDVVSWSRLAVLMPKNRFTLLGSWHCTDDCGCFFSNASWKHASYKPVKGYGVNHAYDDYGGSWWGDGGYGEAAAKPAASAKQDELMPSDRKNWLGASLLSSGVGKDAKAEPSGQAEGNAATLAAASAALGCAKTQRIAVPDGAAPLGARVKRGRVWMCSKKEVTLKDGTRGATFVMEKKG